MYEHPYLSHRANELELEQLERAIARRRFLEEHADQIVLRPESAMRRGIRRVLGMAPRAPRAAAASDAAPSDAAPSWVTPDDVTRRATSDSASASASASASGSRRSSAPCEPVPAG